MKHTSNLRNYIYQKEFKITIKKNMIDIENFTNIGKIENYEIVIYKDFENNIITIVSLLYTVLPKKTSKKAILYFLILTCI